ncbi:MULTISPECIES: DUF1652 domain-containing protein [Pseudomonas]|nr:DUF1652 domain-containing protein [Pseudomonas savastanoi]
MKCVCTIEPDGSMFIQIFDQSTGKEELTVTGIAPSCLGSSRAIASLVTELKEDMRRRSLAPERRNKAHKA